MRMAYLTVSAGLCAIASCAWGVCFHEKGGAEKISRVPSAVERANKSDRVVRAFNVPGAVMAAFSVEIVDSHDADVTVRNHDGKILYRVSSTERMTTVAKGAVQKPVATPERVPAPQEIGPSEAAKELPDGCESAFSPYVEPGMANIIGRCVS